MKKHGIFKSAAGARAAVQILAVLCCASCYLSAPEGEDEIPSGFPPVAWKDSMVFLATTNPSQVQLWDTETRTLVRQYLFPQAAEMDITEMAADKDCFWINIIRRKNHLIKVNVSAGTVQELAIDIRPVYLQYIEDALWVFDLPDPWKGFNARRLNREGAVEQSVTVKRNDIDFVQYKDIIFVDGSFLVPIQTNPYDKKNGTCFYIANLSKGGALTPVPVGDLYPSGFSEAAIYDAISKPDPWQIGFNWYPEGYADVLFLHSEILWRWFYKVESFLPLKLSGPIITHHRQGDRSNFYLATTAQNLFIGGRLLRHPADDAAFDGLEIGVYPPEGGEEIKALRLRGGNQLIYARKNGETWFGKDIWTWDYEKNQQGPDAPVEAYRFDETNARLYRVSANGAAVEIPPL